MNFNRFPAYLFLLIAGIGFQTCTSSKPEPQIYLAELTISEIHMAFQNGDYTAEQLVNAYLERITLLDDQTHAITQINPEAVAIARGLDEEFKESGELRPLHGIPLIVKDNINTAGLPTTAGSIALRDYVPEEDAFIIRQLVEAGAIILAKSNMAEWAFSPMHSESSTAGTTRNPYDLSHVPAGSSGGTAAAVAANMGTVGLGTDTGNSIRGPSSHCALVGFRPTIGLISRSAIVPLYLRNDVVGPMCRTVERRDPGHGGDDRCGIRMIPSPDTQRARCRRTTPNFCKKTGCKGRRVGVLRALTQEAESRDHDLV